MFLSAEGIYQQFRLNVSGKILATIPIDSDPDNIVVTGGVGCATNNYLAMICAMYIAKRMGDTSLCQ